MDGYSSEKLLSLLANMSISAGKSSLVDEKAGKCYFDTEEFVELLEFCKKYGMEPGSVSGEEEMIHPCFGDLASFSMMMAELGEGYHCVGYPVDSGSGGFVECPFLVGVNDRTENKEIVSDFLQSLLSDRKQSMSGCASVRKDVLCSGVMEHSSYTKTQYMWMRYSIITMRGPGSWRSRLCGRIACPAGGTGKDACPDSGAGEDVCRVGILYRA